MLRPTPAEFRDSPNWEPFCELVQRLCETLPKRDHKYVVGQIWWLLYDQRQGDKHPLPSPNRLGNVLRVYGEELFSRHGWMLYQRRSGAAAWWHLRPPIVPVKTVKFCTLSAKKSEPSPAFKKFLDHFENRQQKRKRL